MTEILCGVHAVVEVVLPSVALHCVGIRGPRIAVKEVVWRRFGETFCGGNSSTHAGCFSIPLYRIVKRKRTVFPLFAVIRLLCFR